MINIIDKIFIFEIAFHSPFQNKFSFWNKINKINFTFTSPFRVEVCVELYSVTCLACPDLTGEFNVTNCKVELSLLMCVRITNHGPKSCALNVKYLSSQKIIWFILKWGVLNVHGRSWTLHGVWFFLCWCHLFMNASDCELFVYVCLLGKHKQEPCLKLQIALCLMENIFPSSQVFGEGLGCVLFSQQ